jgi:hypothetical protein
MVVDILKDGCHSFCCAQITHYNTKQAGALLECIYLQIICVGQKLRLLFILFIYSFSIVLGHPLIWFAVGSDAPRTSTSQLNQCFLLSFKCPIILQALLLTYLVPSLL